MFWSKFEYCRDGVAVSWSLLDELVPAQTRRWPLSPPPSVSVSLSVSVCLSFSLIYISVHRHWSSANHYFVTDTWTSQPDVVWPSRKLGDSDGPSQWIICSFQWERTSELPERCESLCISDFMVYSTLVWSQECIILKVPLMSYVLK